MFNNNAESLANANRKLLHHNKLVFVFMHAERVCCISVHKVVLKLQIDLNNSVLNSNVAARIERKNRRKTPRRTGRHNAINLLTNERTHRPSTIPEASCQGSAQFPRWRTVRRYRDVRTLRGAERNPALKPELSNSAGVLSSRTRVRADLFVCYSGRVC